MLVSTTVVGLIIAGLAFLSVRRLWRNGLCDCHKDSPYGNGCAGGCAGCSGCPAAAPIHTTSWFPHWISRE